MAEEVGGYAPGPGFNQVGDRYDMFAELRAEGSVIRREGFVVTTTWAAADEVFRHPELYSGDWPSIGNTRPMIPINKSAPAAMNHQRFQIGLVGFDATAPQTSPGVAGFLSGGYHLPSDASHHPGSSG